ncbi:hypothetical protein JW926_17360 [Candidatus Sumerlaeota bacterium]|nr:hypothetical protein [Candidatus Sumerlaeota bacterium]
MTRFSLFLSRYSVSFISWAWAIFWQSSVLIILIASFSLFLKKVSPGWKHLLWLLVIIRLFLPPSFYLPTGIGNWMHLFFPPESAPVIGQNQGLNTAPHSASSNFTADYGESSPSGSSFRESLHYTSVLFILWIAGLFALTICLLYKIFWLRKILNQASAPPEWLFQKAAIYSDQSIRQCLIEDYREIFLEKRFSNGVSGHY